jgi:hypothetical protein
VEAAKRLLAHRDACRNRLPKSTKTDAQSAQVCNEIDPQLPSHLLRREPLVPHAGRQGHPNSHVAAVGAVEGVPVRPMRLHDGALSPRKKPPFPAGSVKRMKGLEPSTFCMANTRELFPLVPICLY